MKLKIEIDVPDQMLIDIMHQGFFQDGIFYWAEEVTWDPTTDTLVVSDFDGEDGDLHTITPATIGEGLRQAFMQNKVSSELRMDIFSGEMGQSDCTDSDTIIQLGLFGKLVYG